MNTKSSYTARWRKKNPEADAAIRARARAKRRAAIHTAKDGPCYRCGGRFPACAMDFHHRDPTTKLFTVGNGAYGMRATLAEIAKCDLYCANCHRIIEHEESA